MSAPAVAMLLTRDNEGKTEVQNDAARRRHDAPRPAGAAVVPDLDGGRPAVCVRYRDVTRRGDGVSEDGADH